MALSLIILLIALVPVFRFLYFLRYWFVSLALLFVIVFLVGCATTEEKEFNKYCRERGSAYGDSRCAKPKPPRNMKDYVEFCEYRGSRKPDNCYWVPREQAKREIERILNGR